MILNDVLGKIYGKAHDRPGGSVLHRLSLLGAHAALIVTTPSDIWAGDAGRGQWLCSGTFEYEGAKLALGAKGWRNDAVLTHDFWAPYAMGFSWLRDFKALGGDAGRLGARRYIEGWLGNYAAWDGAAWTPAWTGARIANWLTHYDFYGRSAPDDFIARLLGSISRQLRHLTLVCAHRSDAGEGISAAKGLIFGGLCLEGQGEALTLGADLLKKALAAHVLPDGGHVTRSPQILMDAACDLLDIILLCRKSPHPAADDLMAAVQPVHDRMLGALRVFRMRDGRLPLFNGTQEGDTAQLDMLLRADSGRLRRTASLPDSGYERLGADKSCLIVDTGVPPRHKYNAHAHAGLLAFEFSHGKDRLIVNCGTHPVCPEWQHMLKATAAHSTLTVDERNACEILPCGHIGRTPPAPKPQRTQITGGEILQVGHTGYESALGITHMRRFFLSDSGADLRGEDTLICEGDLKAPCPFTLRFHLHPRVQASVVPGGDVLLRLPGGSGWRFRHEGAQELSLESGIYLGKGTVPRKTSQIVISGIFPGGLETVKWALQMDGR